MRALSTPWFTPGKFLLENRTIKGLDPEMCERERRKLIVKGVGS